eukprot:XP_017169285.1 PREDICTED: putative tubulin-like protein alpha-4B isoform X2 [Mus musculus]
MVSAAVETGAFGFCAPLLRMKTLKYPQHLESPTTPPLSLNTTLTSSGWTFVVNCKASYDICHCSLNIELLTYNRFIGQVISAIANTRYINSSAVSISSYHKRDHASHTLPQATGRREIQ